MTDRRGLRRMERSWALGGLLALGLAGALGAQAPAETKETYGERAKAQVEANLRQQPNTRRAKNVILFVGDGMGVTTITAARILAGQLTTPNQGGEENLLSFEKFPYLAHSKTYQVNQQVADSAPTMTALITGYKARDGMLSVDPFKVLRNDDFAGAAKPESHLQSLLEKAESQGLWTGVVSTARVTHATPGACYAHTSHRDAESAADLARLAQSTGREPGGLQDIAAQLLDFRVRPTTLNGKPSQGLEVVLGGGRSKFMLDSQTDPEDGTKKGEQPARDLVKEWVDRGGAYVTNLQEFAGLQPQTTGPVLGLFEPSYMQYELDRAGKPAPDEPSLAEMTTTAIRILERGPKGFFLMIEAGRIDHGLHAGNAKRALYDTMALAKAVDAARALTGDDTLILVTADHSHTLTMSGYPKRGNPILGLVVGNNEVGEPETKPSLALDGKPYTTLGFANGPGSLCTCKRDEQSQVTCDCPPRADLSAVDTTANDFRQQSLVPTPSETHGGEDVVIYARGPWAHLVQGTMEENAVYWVMAKALGWW
jgi:alkaline phosphatase